jgi:hypothetical protein
MTSSVDTATALAELGAQLVGDALDPTAAGTPFNLATAHHPDLVVRAAAVADVSATVRYAARTGRRIAVQATGHGAAAVGPGTILLLTGDLDDVRVDPDAGTAAVGAGTRWQQVLDAAAPYGLGGLCGSAPGVGVVGYTLGGGLGPVARSFGLAADRVRSVDLVGADGDLRRIDADSDPDLFWALRGGGGAFGVAVGMEFELVPVTALYAGGLWFPADVARRVLHGWRSWAATLPESVTTSVARLNLPPAPELPEPLRGRAVVHVRFAHVGDLGEGERLAAPLRALAPPLLDTLGALPYAALGAIHADPTEPMPVCEQGVLLADLPPAAVEAFADVTAPSAGLPVMLTELRLLGGAVARTPEVPDAIGPRSAAFHLQVIGVLAPPIAAAVPGAVQTVVERMVPWATGGAWPNFAGGVDGVAGARVRRGYGAGIERLDALRRERDPQGMFAPQARWPLA